jgi:hypothetical protein
LTARQPDPLRIIAAKRLLLVSKASLGFRRASYPAKHLVKGAKPNAAIGIFFELEHRISCRLVWRQPMAFNVAILEAKQAGSPVPMHKLPSLLPNKHKIEGWISSGTKLTV